MLRILIFYIIITFTYCEENITPVGLAKLTEEINKTELGLCAYGDGYLPFKVFNSYVGWQCYEEAYKDVKKYSLYACNEELDVIYQIPCLKIGSKMISFNLSNPENVDLISKTVESDELKNRMIQCYLSVMAYCESQQFAGVSRPNTEFGTWVWVPNSDTAVCDVQTRSKFHVALLSISLIIGFPAVIILFYYCWTTNRIALPYHRDLLTALVFRTLFTLIIQSNIFLDMINVSTVFLKNDSTCKFLASMETIFGNLVWSFFVSEAIYLHKYAKNGFSKEPDLRIYNYILTGLSVAFAIIWIIVMAAAHDSHCWLGDRTWIQWINDPLRIIFIIVHLVLVGDVIRMLLTKLKAVHDDTARILRRISLYTFVLIPLFLLQFALNAGQPEGTDCQDAYFYTLYFVDGMQCAVVSLFFFYFDKQIRNLVKKTLGLEKSAENEQSNFRKGNMERSITTIDATQPAKPERNKELEDTRPDVNYSSVVHPEQLEKIIHLYNRMNLNQKPSVTLNDGEEYISCVPEPAGNRKISVISEYYDVESLNDFHDAIAYQSSLSIFHDVNEFFDPNDKILSDENFQKKLKGNVQQGESQHLMIPPIEKNEINAVQNKIQRSNAEVQKSEVVTENPIIQNTKPDRVYKSKYLVQDSDSSSSSESEDSVVEVSIRKRNDYEGRVSFQSDASSRPKSESDLSVAIPIPEEVEPPSDGEKTPEVVLGALAFDENKTETVENWIKNNEELYAKYLEKKGFAVPTIIISTETTDFEAELNKRNDDAELSDSSEIIEEQQKNIGKQDFDMDGELSDSSEIVEAILKKLTEKKDDDVNEELSDSLEIIKTHQKDITEKENDSDESLSDQESGTESSKIKIKDIRRVSDVYHLLSGSESETEENKKFLENAFEEKVFEGKKNQEENHNVTEKDEKNFFEGEHDTNIFRNLENSSQEITKPDIEVTDMPVDLKGNPEVDVTELSYPFSHSDFDDFPLLTAEAKSVSEESLSEGSEDAPNKPSFESDSEFEVEKLKRMIPVKKHSSSSSYSSSSSSSNHSTKPAEFKEPELEQSESECSSSGVNDYYSNLASKMYSPSELKRLNDSTQPPQPQVRKKVFDSVKSFETNPALSKSQSNDDFDPLPKDILEVDPKNKELSEFIRDEENLGSSNDDSYTLREKPGSLFSQDHPDIYDDLKNYPNRKSRENSFEKRQNYSDMFSKYKSKLLTEKNKSKSLEDVLNEKASDQKVLPSSSSVDTFKNIEYSGEEEVPSRLEKSKGFINLNEEVESGNTKVQMLQTSESDSSKNGHESDSSSSDDSVGKSKPKPTKRSFAPRQITSNKDDDWEPQKVFY